MHGSALTCMHLAPFFGCFDAAAAPAPPAAAAAPAAFFAFFAFSRPRWYRSRCGRTEETRSAKVDASELFVTGNEASNVFCSNGHSASNCTA